MTDNSSSIFPSLSAEAASPAGLGPFYDQLLQFSLFQGLSRSELLQMAGNTRFGFHKLEAGKILIHEGDTCQQVYFLVRGTLQVVCHSDGRGYFMSERLQAPWQLHPEALFGTTLRYSYTVSSLTDCHFIVLSKDEVLRLLDEMLIFRLNYLNLLATKSQQHAHRSWRRSPSSLSDRLVRFFIDHVVYPAGRKELHILMKQLAMEVNDSRLNVSRALNGMQRQGLVELRRGCIIIPSLERLFM
jgi:CRP-like cAMP-binding protein